MKVIDLLNILMDDEKIVMISDGKRIEYMREDVPYKYIKRQIEGVALSTSQGSLLIYTTDGD